MVYAGMSVADDMMKLVRAWGYHPTPGLGRSLLYSRWRRVPMIRALLEWLAVLTLLAAVIALTACATVFYAGLCVYRVGVGVSERVTVRAGEVK